MAIGADAAWLGHVCVSKQLALNMLSAKWPELNLTLNDLVDMDGDWTIDGLDPYVWCKAMTMD